MSEDSEETVYECLVVGAGIEGSCTARYAASHGKKTLCLEQVIRLNGRSQGRTL